MSYERNEQLKNLTMKLLARLNAPRAVIGNEDATKDEALFIIKKVQNLAPVKNYVEWFEQFQEELLNNLETRSWPTGKHLSNAAREIAPKRPEFRDDTAEKYKPDPLKINADRIKNNQDVGDNYITGTMADQMLRLGLISEDDLKPYKKYLKNARDELYKGNR
tara:strand:+ start:7329 stop:7817 length:489 start_codon:yes stop_codon:yes gene_type:complete